MATKKVKKMTNEGHTGKVVLGRSIGVVFLVGTILGGFVTFFAVAGRTGSVISEQRALNASKKAKAAEAAAVPSLSPSPVPAPVSSSDASVKPAVEAKEPALDNTPR